jgi:hypothetical protein
MSEQLKGMKNAVMGEGGILSNKTARIQFKSNKSKVVCSLYHQPPEKY